MDRFALRFRARKYQREQFRLEFGGLRGMRASLIPHQLHIAYEVGQRHAPRVLFVVPETLQHQWLVEMLRRFNLRFSLFDDDRYAESLHEATNAFETEQLVICSLDFVRRNKSRLEQLADAEWDLLVVDEAHHLVWSEEAPSREYQVIEQLSQQIPSVLLLTATPEQLGQQSHLARLRLLDPDRFHDYEEFIHEQQQYQPVADAVTLLINKEPLTQEALTLLGESVGNADTDALLKAANNGDEAAAKQLVAMLMDRHGTSRVLFRNTRNGVKGFPDRHLYAVKLPLPTQYQTAIKVSG